MNYRKNYEQQTGETLPTTFDVHHIDFNRSNNDINNLVALPKELHQNYHTRLYGLPLQVSLEVKLQSVKQGGNNYMDWLSFRIEQFTESYVKCCKWVDYREFLLGNLPNIHGLDYSYGEDIV